MVARFLHTEEVTGSIPVSPTIQAGSLRSGSLCMRCPGYCGDCLRSDWRFGMGQRQYSMELRERASSTPRQTPNLSTSPFSSNNARATAPVRGATPVMGRCTRYGPLHPIRRGALPADRVQRTQSQEQTRNLRDDRRHAQGGLKNKTCWFCSKLPACWCGKINIEGGSFIVGV